MPNKQFKFINDNVINFQAIVDKERISLYWDNLSRTKSLTSLTINNNDISLTTIVSVGDSMVPYNTFTAASSGLSLINEKYTYNYLIFLDSFNYISLPKQITSYSDYQFVIDDIEYQIIDGSRFGISSAIDLIDDNNIYTNSTITYTTTANFEHKITAYDSSTKTFTVSGTIDSNFAPGDNFTLSYAYYPKLYVSIDNGVTYDDGINLIYTVTNSTIGLLLNNSYYYNTFKDSNSLLLNISDNKFYIGAYVTFLTGLNKGISRKILSFDIATKEFTTEYFSYPIAQNDMFTINTYSFPLVNDIADYIFKIVLWNYDENNPIYGKEVVTHPALSLKNYMDSLDNGYWDTSLNTNLYTIVQGIAKEGHSRAEIETILQKLDFSIDEVRDNKLYDNFGKNLYFEKNNETSYIRYRKSIKDIIAGFRNVGTYECLYNICRAFSRITPSIDFLSNTGWRLGDLKLGYNQTIVNKEVTSEDNTIPYNTINTTITSLATGSNAYIDGWLYFTNAPYDSQFNQALYGTLLPIISYSTSGDNATFTINASGISTPIPSGAEFSILNLNTTANYGTIPYSSLAFLFGVRLNIYGPTLNVQDIAILNSLLSRAIPLHINYVIRYTPNFIGETSWGEFNGSKTNLKIDYETGALISIKDQLLEHSRLTDIISSTVTYVSSGAPTTTFSVSGTTSKYDYYKNKYILCTSGNNNGISRKVNSYVDRTFTTESFPYNIQVGDIFKLETINYQTKYTTQSIDLGAAEIGANLFDNIFICSWFARKIDTAIVEKVYIEFSNDQIVFTKPRELTQNEELNSTILASVTSVNIPTTTFSLSANNLSSINDYYNNMLIKFTSGNNSDESQLIVDYTANIGEFVTETFSEDINAGDFCQLSITDAKRYARMTIYHNYLQADNDLEIESLTIKIL